MAPAITACLVVYNEERIIRRCLESIRDAVDEIIVVHDGPCTDRTLDICRRYTDRIFVRPRIGVAEPHRVAAFEQATGEWILSIDADEVVSRELGDRLRDLVRQDDVDLYSFLWPYWDGRQSLTLEINHPYRACLARRSRLYFFGLPHEPMRSRGKSRKVRLVLEHRPEYDNFTWHKFRAKWLPWARLQAELIRKPPEEIPCFGLTDRNVLRQHLRRFRALPLPKIPFKFCGVLTRQLYKGMWRLGWVGWRIALLEASYAAVLRYYISKSRGGSELGDLWSTRSGAR